MVAQTSNFDVTGGSDGRRSLDPFATGFRRMSRALVFEADVS